MSKPRWKVPILAVAAVLAATATGCGDNSVDQAVQGKESDKGATASKASVAAPESIKSQGKLTTCMDVSFPPMEFYEGANTKKPIGFDVDLMSAVAGTMDVKADFTPTSFDGLLPVALELALRCRRQRAVRHGRADEVLPRGAVPALEPGAAGQGRQPGRHQEP